MRIGREKAQHVAKRIEAVGHTCDLCGLVVGRDKNAGNADDVEINARIGDRWDDGDCTTVHEIDVCVPCFVAKVKPAIEALGCKFRERDGDCRSGDEYWQRVLREDEKF